MKRAILPLRGHLWRNTDSKHREGREGDRAASCYQLSAACYHSEWRLMKKQTNAGFKHIVMSLVKKTWKWLHVVLGIARHILVIIKFMVIPTVTWCHFWIFPRSDVLAHMLLLPSSHCLHTLRVVYTWGCLMHREDGGNAFTGPAPYHSLIGYFCTNLHE